ncbi:MAG: histidine phosphatase family protein [Rhodospirillales bacterium]|jgi:broad specificity phosphatase PhoE|nr:histidine phosphatase family protein [Rhodospirillales bacterium]
MRHTESLFNAAKSQTGDDPGIADPGLTARGAEQAREVAAFLSSAGVRRIVSSPYIRALETAAIVADTLGLAIAVDAGVGERAAFSCDVGTPSARLRECWPHLDLDHLDDVWWPPFEESETALAVRCEQFREALVEAGDWTGLLVISHWAFIRELTGHAVLNGTVLRLDPAAAPPPAEVVKVPADAVAARDEKPLP